MTDPVTIYGVPRRRVPGLWSDRPRGEHMLIPTLDPQLGLRWESMCLWPTGQPRPGYIAHSDEVSERARPVCWVECVRQSCLAEGACQCAGTGEEELVTSPECRVRTWLDNDDATMEELYEGPPTILRADRIDVRWTGHGYDWTYAGLPFADER